MTAGGHCILYCTIHRETCPSLRVFPKTGYFFCYGCHNGGFLKDHPEVQARKDLLLERLRREDGLQLALPGVSFETGAWL